jgi:hypothetical protein
VAVLLSPVMKPSWEFTVPSGAEVKFGKVQAVCRHACIVVQVN